MIRIYKHIAFILFGIFVFPIIYQPVHVVVHQTHRRHGSCHCHNHEKNSYLLAEHASDQLVFKLKKDKCPVCSYEFSINTLSEIAIYKSYIPSAIKNFNEGKVVQIKQLLFNKKSPRAPPSVFA